MKKVEKIKAAKETTLKKAAPKKRAKLLPLPEKQVLLMLI